MDATETTAAPPRSGDMHGARGIALCFALAKLALHLSVNFSGGYGYFRDELYYLACSRELAAGYVDQPPLSVFILALQRALIGDSLFALRFIPACAGAAVVYLTGRLAWRLGAGRFGQGLACLAAFASPIALGFGGYYSMNVFDLLIWVAAANLFAKLLEEDRPRTWIELGVLLGLGLLNKISVLWLVFGIFAGLLLTRERTRLRSPWPWIAAGIALCLFAPFVIWNLQHDNAHLEFIRNASSGKYSGLSIASFLLGQLSINQPLSAPLWILGLFFFFGFERGARFRPLGWIWLSACLVLALNGHSKPEYLATAYPILYAGGAAALDSLRQRWIASWAKPAYALLLAATSVLLVPLALPILPVESYIRYAKRLNLAPSTAENKELGLLPQYYADMFGWPAKAAAVVEVYRQLTPEDQKDCAIFASNYGLCGAIDCFGRSQGLPRAIGSHNNYWIWGPRGATGRVMIILGRSLGEHASMFESVTIAAVVPHDEYCMPYENDLTVFVCRNLKKPLAEVWPELKHFD